MESEELTAVTKLFKRAYKQRRRRLFSYFSVPLKRMTPSLPRSPFPTLKISADASRSRITAFIFFFQQSLSAGGADALIRMRESLPPTAQRSCHVIVILEKGRAAVRSSSTNILASIHANWFLTTAKGQ